MKRPRIKICCISSLEEAQLAINCGCDALGLVGKMPSGPGVISDVLIRHIAKNTPPPIATFLLTSETNSQTIIEHHQKVNTSTIQMVDKIAIGTHQDIRTALPTVKLVQVIHVLNQASIDEAIQASKHADAILLDSGNPNLRIKTLGGTGKTHNWEISRAIRESLTVPVFLAGGISTDNAKRAMDIVQPFGLDLCSSVRTNGHLDEKKLKAFFSAVG